MQKALGLIETRGLTASITAADAAVKSANVTLLGYEYARGAGLTTIKVEGDIGAVRAAVDAGSKAASMVGKVIASHVIPRPADSLGAVCVRNERMIGGVSGKKPDGNMSKPQVQPKKVEETKVEEKKVEEKKPEVSKAEEKKTEVNKVEEKKPEVKNPETNKSETKKPEEKKTEPKKDNKK